MYSDSVFDAWHSEKHLAALKIAPTDHSFIWKMAIVNQLCLIFTEQQQQQRPFNGL